LLITNKAAADDESGCFVFLWAYFIMIGKFNSYRERI